VKIDKMMKGSAYFSPATSGGRRVDAKMRWVRYFILVMSVLVLQSAYASSFDPTITSFSPASGTVGTAVTILGTKFDPVAANNVVSFNGVTATQTSFTLISGVQSLLSG